MAYPSVISTLSTPQATDRLNSPSHSTLHQNENTGITETQTFVGTLSSAVGTLVYDIRSVNSNGGGHVQTANKGGTGQTSFNKGDLLVATGSSVITKLSVGADNTVLQADSNQSAGIKWGTVIANKVSISTSTISTNGPLTNLFNASIIGSTLGTNNAIRFTAGISSVLLNNSTTTVTFYVNYGNNRLYALSASGSPSGLPFTSGFIQGTIVGNGSDSSQKSLGQAIFSASQTEASGDANVNISKMMVSQYNTSSVVSSANQNLNISVELTGAGAAGNVTGEYFLVEKIV